MIKNLTPIENKSQRVLTTEQLAECYGATTKMISNNFSRNKNRFVEGKHYYKLEGDTLKEFKKGNPLLEDTLKFSSVLYLWTEKGALRHSKILDTDKAWETYEMLEETYFTVKEKILPMLTEEQKLQLKIFDTNTTKDDAIILFKQLQDLKNEEIKQLKPKASAWEQFVNSEGCLTFEEMAKMLSTHAGEEGYSFHISSRKLTEFLRDSGVLSKAKSKHGYKNLPNADYEEYFNTISIDIGEGEKAFKKTQTRVKANGMDYIYRIIKESNFSV